MTQDYGKFWKASLVHDLFISIQLVRNFSAMLQEGNVKFEKSAITLKYAMDSERIYQTRGPGALYRAQEYHCNLVLFFF